MFEIIEQSKQKALIRQQWFNGERGWRIGNPYQWVDGEMAGFNARAKGKVALLSYLTAYYGEFPTPNTFKIKEFDSVKESLKNKLHDIFKANLPFKSSSKYDYYLTSMAHVRTQDYSYIKTYCTDLPYSTSHLDLGPGVGSHALYSLKYLNSIFYGVEAASPSYMAQKDFFMVLSGSNGTYFDVIDAEHIECNKDEINKEINCNDKYFIIHLPSWYFEELNSCTIDLVTATWMLNEVSYSGILWLLANSIRALKKGGYFYIRDSGKLKPNGHSINYDDLLKSLDFILVNKADVKNLIDYYGVPRVYQKTTNNSFCWEDLVKKFIPEYCDVNRGKGNETGLAESIVCKP